MNRPVFGITKPPEGERPPVPYVILCDYCGTEAAWWNIKTTAYMLPVGGNDITHPRELISGGLACQACTKKIGWEVFESGKRNEEFEGRTPMDVREAAYEDSERRIKVWK